MISLYSDACLAWEDYHNNGFQNDSKGIFFADFIDFLKKNHLNEYTECFIDFYEDNFPTLTIFQAQHHFKILVKNQQIEFFDKTSINTQKNFINFCYSSIENLHFPPPSPWIIPEDEFQQDNSQAQNNIIDLTGDTGDEMPPLIDDEMPPLIDDTPQLINYNTEGPNIIPTINYELLNSYLEDIVNNFDSNTQQNNEELLAELEDDSSDDEMPELEEVEHNQSYTNINAITV